MEGVEKSFVEGIEKPFGEGEEASFVEGIETLLIGDGEERPMEGACPWWGLSSWCRSLSRWSPDLD